MFGFAKRLHIIYLYFNIICTLFIHFNRQNLNNCESKEQEQHVQGVVSADSDQ